MNKREKQRHDSEVIIGWTILSAGLALLIIFIYNFINK